ncbi:MAG: TlpA family protein disulfide reductase [Bacillota bacterium]|nr:TlpA family protein disulfide reductase [Bacillota bacterium]HOC06928.1 TlpA disulfide reductase family protein [Bacillota bacterium]HQD20488.1 TlpA disulfide reductase family protein [Bacillota bacterium]
MRKILLLLMVVVLFSGCVRTENFEAKAPGFIYEDLKGEKWSLEELKGDVVVLYFWTSSCGVCIRKLPDMPALQEKLPGNVHLLMLNPYDSKERIKGLIGDAELTVLVDTMVSFNDYNVAYVPTTVFISKKGEIAHTQVGLMANEQILEIIEGLR